MKKKLLISLAGIFGLLILGLLITSYVLAQKIRKVADERKNEPDVYDRGVLEKPMSKPHKFKMKICEDFPVTVQSDMPEDNAMGRPLCDVSFRNQKLALIYDKDYVKDILMLYDHPIMSEFKNTLSNKEKFAKIFESKGPGDVNFLLSKKDMQESLLFLVNGMNKKFKSWEKYQSGKYLVYVWDVTGGAFDEIKIQLIAEDYSITCMGPTCIDYLFQAGIL